MASVFEGTTPSAHRRRRLMSVEDVAAADSLLLEYGITVAAEVPAMSDLGSHGDHLPGRLISKRLWKHLLIIIPLLLFMGTPLALQSGWNGYPAEILAARPEASARMVRIAEGMAGALLLLASQLSILIFLIRSDSTVDFRGRYRVWSWLGILLSVAAGGLMTGSLSDLPDLAAMVLEPVTGPLNAARPALALVPLTALMIFIICRVLPDMGGYRPSQLMLALSAGLLSWLVLVGTGRISGFQSDSQSAVLLMWTSGLLFSSCLLHARFVIHFSNDPPVIVDPEAVAGKPAVADQPVEAEKLAGVGTPAILEQLAPVRKAAVVGKAEVSAEPAAENSNVSDAQTSDSTDPGSRTESAKSGKSERTRSSKKQNMRKAG
jgi:hypothetical protein